MKLFRALGLSLPVAMGFLSPDTSSADEPDDEVVGTVSQAVNAACDRQRVTGRRHPTACCNSRYNCQMPQVEAPDGPRVGDRKGCGDDGNGDRNRTYNPRTESCKWELDGSAFAQDGGVPVLDHDGRVYARIRGSHVEVNYGMRRKIGGAWHVMGFRVAAKGDCLTSRDPMFGCQGTSGWVPLSAFAAADRARLEKMPEVAVPRPADPKDGATYTVTGGSPPAWRVQRNGKPTDDKCKVVVGGEGNLAGADYLVRDFGNVPLVYSVPGFQIGGQAKDALHVASGATFVRTKGVPSIAVRARPGKGVSGSCPGKPMRFLYGRVGDEYGWVSRSALTPKGGAR